MRGKRICQEITGEIHIMGQSKQTGSNLLEWGFLSSSPCLQCGNAFFLANFIFFISFNFSVQEPVTAFYRWSPKVWVNVPDTQVADRDSGADTCPCLLSLSSTPSNLQPDDSAFPFLFPVPVGVVHGGRDWTIWTKRVVDTYKFHEILNSY